MKTEELESILEGATETQTIDFKRGCAWDVNTFAKDILAMSNVRDGGYIVIGVQDQTFVRQGVTPAIRRSYNIDIMRDQMTAYADPYVNFLVDFPKDLNSKEYVIIRVQPFEEIPVVCKKDGQDIKAGTIYYRNRNRRIESAPVSNSYDMREIITLATVRMMQRTREYGFTVEGPDKKKLDDELKGL